MERELDGWIRQVCQVVMSADPDNTSVRYTVSSNILSV